MQLAFLDIETTGLDPDAHEVLEVAYIRERDYGPNVTHFTLPIDESLADEEALRINGYHDRKRQLADLEIEPYFAAKLMTAELDGHLIVANNPTFDLSFLRVFLTREGFDVPWYYRPLDLGSFAAGHFAWETIKRTADVAEATGVKLPEDQHTALADAWWNFYAYKALVTPKRTRT